MIERPLDATDMDALVAALGATGAEEMARWFHPYANAFPLMPADEQDGLGASMAESGQREPAVIFEGLILDGRNRVIQCRKRGLTPRVRPYDPAKDGPDPLKFVRDLNLERRHLTASQRAAAAVELEGFRHGGARREQGANLRLELDPAPQPEPTPRKDLAEQFHVSERLIDDAAKVKDAGVPALQDAVKRGELVADVAAAVAGGLAPAQQTELLASLPRDASGALTPEAKKAVRKVARELRDQQNAEKKKRRSEREQDLGAKIAALPDEVFGFILEDPEWQFAVRSRETGLDRAADNHYPTSDDDTLLTKRAQDVARLAAPHCVLGMWTTDLARGIDAMRARGFVPKSYLVWVKTHTPVMLDGPTRVALSAVMEIPLEDIPDQVLVRVKAPGTGFWNVDEDELFLIGTKGSPVCPAMGEQGGSVWYEPRREHSVKPEISYAWIEKHFANTPRIELNARRRRPGWQVWGNEVEPAPREIVTLEREALKRGLISDLGMVQTPDGPALFSQLDVHEWNELLAQLCVAGEAAAASLGEPPRYASQVRAASDAPLRTVPHFEVTAAAFPSLHRAFESISHDSGAGCGYESYPVPARHHMQIGAIEAALAALGPEDMETFCIGEQSEAEAIRQRDGGSLALDWAAQLLVEFFEGFLEDRPADGAPEDAASGDEPAEEAVPEDADSLDIPAFLRRQVV